MGHQKTREDHILHGEFEEAEEKAKIRANGLSEKEKKLIIKVCIKNRWFGNGVANVIKYKVSDPEIINLLREKVKERGCRVLANSLK